MNCFRTTFAYILGFVIASTSSGLHAQIESDSTPALKQAAKGLFEIGVGLGLNAVNNDSAIKLLKTEFDYVTPENCMKPAAVQNLEGEFTFDDSDRMVKFASENKLKIVGHCLVWAKDDRTPEWFFKSDNRPASRQLLMKRMKEHMERVITKYGNSINQWDVVNEVLADGAETWRKSSWQDICGQPDFIVEAFKVARNADPTATLIYNDYRSELPGKREHLFKLIEYLQENKAPIDAIGLQGHYELGEVPFDDLEFTIDKVRGYGLKIVISEVDIDVVKRGKWWADGGKHREELAKYDPYADGCPAEILEQQANEYAKLFEIYAKNADIIERVTFWNLHDGQSWLNYFPWERANHPLLFDRELKRKPAHKAVVDVLTKHQTKLNQTK